MATSDSNAIQLPLAIEGLTVEIPLSQGYSAVLDAIDADLSAYKWSIGSRGSYARRAQTRRGSEVKRYIEVLLHRTVLARILGRELLSNECVDHIDGDGLNDRRSNLRLATVAQNAHNAGKQRNNTSGYKGVTWVKCCQKWQAQIMVNRVLKYLGTFDTPEAAYAAYCIAAHELHGEFARLE